MDIRVRLRPWLESRLNDGWIDGLKWIDKEKGIFKIPWKHHSKHTWTEDDAAIFKDWAVVTGRYREGIDSPDWPMWKTRLRCALNKAPDIQEVKQRHNLHCEEPFKVYRFISKTESLWRANATRNASMIFDGISVACKLGPTNVPVLPRMRADISSPIPMPNRPAVYIQRVAGLDSTSRPFTLIHRRNDGVFVKHLQVHQRPSVYAPQTHRFSPSRICGPMDVAANQQVIGLDVVPDYDDDLTMPPRYTNHYPIGSSDVRHITNATNLPVRCFPGFNSLNQTAHMLPDIMEPEYHQLGVRIQHLNFRVKDAIITNPNGCCIYFGRFDEINSPAAPDPVEAQIPHHVSETNKGYVDLLLDNMVRGIVLSVVHGSIYAERMCKCAVFVYIPTANGSFLLLKKLGRRCREKIFDYDRFLTELQLFRHNQHSRPHFEVILAFGQQLKPGISSESLLVWSRVASCRAWFQLHKNRYLVPNDNRESYNGEYLQLERSPHLLDNDIAVEDGYMESSDTIVLNRGLPVRNTSSNGFRALHSIIKVDEMDFNNEQDVAAINLVDSLDPDDIVTEQIIEEGVEVPLDDTNDLTYDTPSSVIQSNLMSADINQSVHSNTVCVPISSVTRDVFLIHSDPSDLKAPLLSSVDDVITSTFVSDPRD